MAFDAADNYIISWSMYADFDNTPPQKPGINSLGVYLEEFAGGEEPNTNGLVPGVATGAIIPLGTMIRPVTRVNSGVSPVGFGDGIFDHIGFYPAGYTSTSATCRDHPLRQHRLAGAARQRAGRHQRQRRYDGQLRGLRTGRHRDHQLGRRRTEIMDQILAQPANGDLLAAWPDLAELNLPWTGGSDGNTGDTDSEINAVLTEAQTGLRLHRRPDWPARRDHEPGGHQYSAATPTA